MKILLLWDYYDRYLQNFYSNYPDAVSLPYQEQLQVLLDDFCTWTAYLVPQLRTMGHTADIVIGNAAPLQRAWARENNVPFDRRSWRFGIAREQIRRFRPDVLWLCGAEHYLGDFLREIRSACRRVIAWRAVRWHHDADWRDVDCVLTSYANLVDEFRRLGKRSDLVLPCFDEDILHDLSIGGPDIDLSFIGSMNPIQFARRLDILRYVHKRAPVRIFAERPVWRRRPVPLAPFLSQARFAPFLLRMQRDPAVYGLNMFATMRRSKMTLNVHERSSANLAGNIRMFESTGTGTLLVTEAAPNLSQLFESDREVVTYRSKEEAVEKIRYYLEHDNERQSIASAGQRRTLRDHNSRVRAQEVVEIFQNTLR